MMKLFRWLSVLISFFIFGNINAQPKNAAFRNITSAEGLPNTSVSDVKQDAFGLIWIATWDGVYKYDGKKYTRITDRDSRLIEVDKKGGVWMSFTGDGSVGYYNPYVDSIKEYNLLGNFRTIRIVVDNNDNVWVGFKNSIAVLDRKTDSFKIDNNKLISDPFFLSARGNGELLFFVGDRRTNELIIARRSTDGTYSYEKLPVDQNNPEKGKIFNDGFVPIGLVYKGTNGYMIINEHGWAYKNKPGDEWTFQKPQNNAVFENFNESILDSNENLWLSQESGLTKVDIKTGISVTFKNDRLNPNSILPIANVGAGGSLFIDRQGILWTTRYGAGISRLNLYENDFGLVKKEDGSIITDVISALELSDGTYFIGSRTPGNSLYRFDANGKIIEVFGTTSFKAPPGRTVSKELSHPFPWSLAKTKDGSIWVGTGWPNEGDGGLNRIRPGSKEITRIKSDPADNNSMRGDWIPSILEDGSGRLWFSMVNKGWSWIDPLTEKIGNGFKLSQNFKNGFITSEGDIVVSEKRNYFKVDHNTLQKTPFAASISENEKLHFFLQDKVGRTWFNSPRGFGYLDKKSEKIAWFFDIKKNKFPADEIKTFNLDNNGFVWLATSNGIIKFDLTNNKFIHFGFERGLQGNYFANYLNYIGPSGKLYFGGNGGINVFDPATIQTNPFAPDMVFTGLQLDGKNIQFGEKEAIKKPIDVADKINVGPDISVISIDFTAIHFAGTNSNKFQYKLQGFDKDWRDGGTIGNATYTNLSPGTYTLYIKGSNWDAVWSDGKKSIQIRILPPWYKTWWAYVIYGLLFLFILWLFYRYQKIRTIRKEREKTQQRELEQAREIEKAYNELQATQQQLIQSEKMASLGELTAGIAHEIQNPLNFVNNFSDVNKELLIEMQDEIDKGNISEVKAIASDVIENEEKINHHGKRADAIVKGMLQHSRSSNGVKEPTDINALADEYLRLAYHGLRAKDKTFNATIKTEFDVSIGSVNILPQDIGRVILNLITNAFYVVNEKKHSGIEGYEPTVSVSTKKVGDKIEIMVADNGNGIPQKVIDKIFQPFFTTKPTGQGTGLGLSLSYDIIKAHGGELKVETNEGESLPAGQAGSIFTIQLPV